MTSPIWYALRSKPHKENFVYGQLVANHVEAFYPTVKVKPTNPRASTIRPYFPGYLFVRLNLAETDVRVTQWLPGTMGLVQFGNVPATVPEGFIVELRRRVKAIEEAGGLAFAEIQHGDPVRIVSGPLEGYEAVFDMRLNGSQRVQVLLDMLGRLVKAEVDVSEIRKQRLEPVGPGRESRAAIPTKLERA